MGESSSVPSGLNVPKKLKLLSDEGVHFDAKGKLVSREAWWDGFVVPSQGAVERKM